MLVQAVMINREGLSMEKADKKSEVKEYIYNKIIQSGVPRKEISDDTELVDERLISSIMLIQIITGIEDILDTIVLTDDIGIEEFTTINKIMNVISRHISK